MTIYLDNNATTPLAPQALASMQAALSELYGNPSSLHQVGESAADALGEARRSVAALLGVSAREIVFTSGATESIATALASALADQARRGRTRVLTTAVEHAAAMEPLARWRARGLEVVEIGVDQRGELDWQRLEAELDERCALVNAMLVNNETGVIHDVRAIGARAQAVGARVHVDAVQAAGKLPLELGKWPVDYASFSAHKLHGPKGVGALYVKHQSPFEALFTGGGQESARRAGTQNVVGAVGFGRAAHSAQAWLADEAAPGRLRDAFEQAILADISGAFVQGSARRVWNTCNVRFEGLSGEALVIWLSAQGLCASTGAACSSGKQAPSHVLLAMGLSPGQASACVRFSLSRFTTQEEIERAKTLVAEGVRTLRALAPAP